jgi:hypothetical protein
MIQKPLTTEEKLAIAKDQRNSWQKTASQARRNLNNLAEVAERLILTSPEERQDPRIWFGRVDALKLAVKVARGEIMHGKSGLGASSIRFPDMKMTAKTIFIEGFGGTGTAWDYNLDRDNVDVPDSIKICWDAARALQSGFAVWNNRYSHYEPVPLCAEAADEIERLQDAKRRALAIADERAKENVRLRAERDELIEALRSIWNYSNDPAVVEFARKAIAKHSSLAPSDPVSTPKVSGDA